MAATSGGCCAHVRYPTAIMQYFGTQMNGAGGYDWGMLSGSKSDQMTYFYFNYIPCSGYDWQ